MTAAARPFPLTPDEIRRPRPGDAIVRAIVCHARSYMGREPPAAWAKHLYGEDRALGEIITRAASSPATATGSGWANTFAQTATLDLISTLGPASAASELIRRSLQVEFGRNYQINVPAAISSASDVAFTAEGAPLPVRQLGIGGVGLVPHKAGGIFTFTRELLEHSTPNAERLTRAVLNESVGLALDAVMLDANAASATRPAGLRFGVTPITAATGGGDAAMLQDLQALAAAVAPVGGLQIAFIANPAQAMKIVLRAGVDFNSRALVLASGGLAAGTVMAVAINALAVGADPTPRFEQSKDAGALHMEDVAPLPIASVGSPNVIAAPTRSLWQSDSVGVRLIFECSWGLRATNAVAVVTGATW